MVATTHGQGGPQKLAGIDRVIVVRFGKGSVAKSTVSSTLAVTLARQGRRVGLLDADLYGPGQPRMMGSATAPPAGMARTFSRSPPVASV